MRKYSIFWSLRDKVRSCYIPNSHDNTISIYKQKKTIIWKINIFKKIDFVLVKNLNKKFTMNSWRINSLVFDHREGSKSEKATWFSIRHMSHFGSLKELESKFVTVIFKSKFGKMPCCWVFIWKIPYPFFFSKN